MSADDKVRPYHAKDPARGQEAADAVAAVMQHAKDRDDAARKKAPAKPQPKWMLPLGINLMVFALYLLIAPPDWVVLDPVEGPPVEAQLLDMRVAMHVKADLIRGAADGGALPATLEEVPGAPLPGVDYVPQGSTFQLIATVGEETLVYDSEDPDPAFAAAAAQKFARAGV